MIDYENIKQKANKENENSLIKTYKALIKYIDKEIAHKSTIGMHKVDLNLLEIYITLLSKLDFKSNMTYDVYKQVEHYYKRLGFHTELDIRPAQKNGNVYSAMQEELHISWDK